MPLEAGITMTSGVVRLYTMQDLKKYLKDMLDIYQREFDRSSNALGSLLRSDGGKGMEVIRSNGWAKVGSMFVNVKDAERGSLEILFQIVTEIKPKVAKTEEILSNFDKLEALPLPEDATFLLYLHAGVPERVVVDTKNTRPPRFEFSGRFRTVKEAVAAPVA